MSDAGTPLPKAWQPYVDKLERTVNEQDDRIEELEATIERVLNAEVGEIIYNRNVLIRELPNVRAALEQKDVAED